VNATCSVSLKQLRRHAPLDAYMTLRLVKEITHIHDFLRIAYHHEPELMPTSRQLA